MSEISMPGRVHISSLAKTFKLIDEDPTNGATGDIVAGSKVRRTPTFRVWRVGMIPRARDRSPDRVTLDESQDP
ncbi:hypothetical protein DPEC_G00258880 [Dallia pectoralis]|uniref:Uncharacterized protein n=1 Tax=Dallia pectoralis TaxID=75939 RepID=A0ACC2FRJ5_DALPE|nr:hypothetical protein DPEC_G00258880 [Dallia pectoralis]